MSSLRLYKVFPTAARRRMRGASAGGAPLWDKTSDQCPRAPCALWPSRWAASDRWLSCAWPSSIGARGHLRTTGGHTAAAMEDRAETGRFPGAEGSSRFARQREMATCRGLAEPLRGRDASRGRRVSRSHEGGCAVHPLASAARHVCVHAAERLSAIRALGCRGAAGSARPGARGHPLVPCSGCIRCALEMDAPLAFMSIAGAVRLQEDRRPVPCWARRGDPTPSTAGRQR
jgi:hypothetical protein